MSFGPFFKIIIRVDRRKLSLSDALETAEDGRRVFM
jgi:hypothetical protein